MDEHHDVIGVGHILLLLGVLLLVLAVVIGEFTNLITVAHFLAAGSMIVTPLGACVIATGHELNDRHVRRSTLCRCQACGYPLCGRDANRCSECGMDHTLEPLIAKQRRLPVPEEPRRTAAPWPPFGQL